MKEDEENSTKKWYYFAFSSSLFFRLSLRWTKIKEFRTADAVIFS